MTVRGELAGGENWKELADFGVWEAGGSEGLDRKIGRDRYGQVANE